MARAVKRTFTYRFYPTDEQAAELARTFGCVRKVYNLALAARTEAWTLRQERVTYHRLARAIGDAGWRQFRSSRTAQPAVKRENPRVTKGIPALLGGGRCQGMLVT